MENVALFALDIGPSVEILKPKALGSLPSDTATPKGRPMTRQRRRIAYLCLAASLALMALAAGSARAADPAWMVNGANINATLLPSVAIKEIEPLPGTGTRHLVLLTKVVGLEVGLLCTTMTLVEPALKAEGKSLGKGRFTGCRWVIYLEGKGEEELKGCSVKSETEAAGVIQTRLLKDQLVLHTFAGGATVGLDRIEPEEGIIIANLKTTGECSLPEALTLNGVLYVEDCNAELQQERETHLFIQGPLTSLWLGKDTVEHLETSIDGSVVALLAGAHAGMTWSGLPG